MPSSPEAIILCGGLGTRLRSVMPDLPKALAEVAGRPFLEWLLRSLRAQGVGRVVLATGHLGSMIEATFGDGERLDLALSYSQEAAPLGTGGALRQAAGRISQYPVLVLNGDSYCRFDLVRMSRAHREHGACATIWLVEVAGDRFGSVTVGERGEILSFEEKAATSGLISAGTYLLTEGVVDGIPSGRAVSLEQEVFPALVGCGLYGILGPRLFVDIGTPSSLAAAGELLGAEFGRVEG
jgi:D-glycero-alpha-D-manno-heptose 1-phosphate guanylyltransferase